MALTLTVIGAGPAYSDQLGSAGSSYLVQAGAESIVLDLGQGAFPGLAHRTEPSQLKGVFISHLHPDHFIDLVPLRHYLCRAEFGSGRRLRLIAPRGLDRRLDGVYDSDGFCAAAFDLEPLRAGTWAVGSLSVEARPVPHAGESFAFRVAAGEPDGPGLVYSGDCADADALMGLVRRGDTLLAEATMGPGPVPDGMPHLDGSAAGRLAAAVGTSRLLLTHLRMGCGPMATVRAAAAHWDGPVSVVRPGDTYTV